MTFSWNDPEIKTLLFAYTLAGMLMFGPLVWSSYGPTKCTLGPIDASDSLSNPSLLDALSGTDLWGSFLEIGITFGIGGLTGFAFVVSILFTFAYLPERLWTWLKKLPS